MAGLAGTLQRIRCQYLGKMGTRQWVKHLKSQTKPYNITDEKKFEVIEPLFPNKVDCRLRGEKTSIAELFSLEKLQVVKKKLKNGKDSVPDNIPPEAIREAIKAAPAYLLVVLNNLLKEQVYPRRWKVAKVILL